MPPLSCRPDYGPALTYCTTEIAHMGDSKADPPGVCWFQIKREAEAMSIEGLLERFGFEGQREEWIRRDVADAIKRREMVANWAKRADVLEDEGFPEAAGVARGMAEYLRTCVCYHGHMIRDLIGDVVARETADAQGRAGAGTARFLEPACGGDTCDDCERPLWQHIGVFGRGVLCPFGRAYWQHARALWTPGCDHSARERGCVTREIAKLPRYIV